MVTLAQKQSYHSISNQHDIGSFAIYCCCPIAVLGDRGIEYAVPVAVDLAFDLRVFKGGQLQWRGCKGTVRLAEYRFIKDAGMDPNGSAFRSFACQVDLNSIPRYYIANGQCLGKAVSFAVKLNAIFPDREVVFLLQRQINADKS